MGADGVPGADRRNMKLLVVFLALCVACAMSVCKKKNGRLKCDKEEQPPPPPEAPAPGNAPPPPPNFPAVGAGGNSPPFLPSAGTHLDATTPTLMLFLLFLANIAGKIISAAQTAGRSNPPPRGAATAMTPEDIRVINGIAEFLSQGELPGGLDAFLEKRHLQLTKDQKELIAATMSSGNACYYLFVDAWTGGKNSPQQLLQALKEENSLRTSTVRMLVNQQRGLNDNAKKMIMNGIGGLGSRKPDVVTLEEAAKLISEKKCGKM